MFEIKRAFMPSLFLCFAVLLVLLLSIDTYNYTYWFISISILFSLSLYLANKQIKFNPLSMLVALFILLLILNMEFVRPIKNAEANYLIWLFAGGFFLFTYAYEAFIKHICFSLTVIFVLLSIWGLFQYASGELYLFDMGHRANSIFVTPNTFAASINVILLPAIVFYLIGIKRYRFLFPSLLVMFSALLVTQSRGGWVAFLVSLVIIFVLIRVLDINIDRLKLKKIILGLSLIIVIYSISNLIENDRLINNISISHSTNHLIRSDSIISTMSHRFMLYDIAWQQIKLHPFLGQGFHTYQYFQKRDQIAPYIGSISRYPHNDYLQLWMEIGLLGVLVFISLFIASIYFILKLSKRLEPYELITMLALIVGLSSFYIHALVDFVFYVPFLLLIYGCSFGMLNQIINKYSNHVYEVNLSSKFINFNLFKSLVGLIVISFLSQPAIGQFTYSQAVKKSNLLIYEEAIPFFELARRFAPYEPDYYWYEGAILMNSVKLVQHAQSARRADKLFSKGMSASPYGANNRLARAELHRDYGGVLDKPENLAVILVWNEEALYWRPNDPVILSEYFKTLMAMGEYQKVRDFLANYILRNPDAKEVLEFKEISKKIDKILL
jgi:O-antigen ligase